MYIQLEIEWKTQTDEKVFQSSYQATPLLFLYTLYVMGSHRNIVHKRRWELCSFHELWSQCKLHSNDVIHSEKYTENTIPWTTSGAHFVFTQTLITYSWNNLRSFLEICGFHVKGFNINLHLIMDLVISGLWNWNGRWIKSRNLVYWDNRIITILKVNDF